MTDDKSDGSRQDFFRVIEHEVPAQFPRENTYATVDEHRPLHLLVKQYVPVTKADRSRGGDENGNDNDVTFICAPALGIAKEAYEPFFEDLTRKMWASGNVGVKAIWIADPVQFGQSAVQNRGNLGAGFSWFDHARDLMRIVDYFGASDEHQMSRPLVAVGHSMGGCQVAWLAAMHPGIFDALVLIEPTLLRRVDNANLALMAKSFLVRKEVFDSNEQASDSLMKSPLYKGWDPRVLSKLAAERCTDIENAPSAEAQVALESGKLSGTNGLVVTETPRMSEFTTGFNARKYDDNVDHFSQMAQTDPVMARAASESPVRDLFRWFPNAGMMTVAVLPFVKCRVLYIHGERSDVSVSYVRERLLRETGSGFGGSGGVANGMVQQHVIKGGDHYDIFVPKYEAEIIAVVTEYLTGVQTISAREKVERQSWADGSKVAQQNGDPEFMEALRKWNPRKDPKFVVGKDKKAKL